MRTIHLLLPLLLLCWIQPAHSAEREWIAQRLKTRHFSFEIGVVKDSEDRYSPEAVRVLQRSTGQVIQEETLDTTASFEDPTRLVQLLDVNFDGWPDLSLPNNDGGAGPNASRHFLLYDKDRKLFVHHPQLSELTQPVVHRNRTITSSSRGGCCQHSTETYRFVNGGLLLIAEWSETVSPDGNWIVTTKRQLQKGHWREKTSRRRAPNPVP